MESLNNAINNTQTGVGLDFSNHTQFSWFFNIELVAESLLEKISLFLNNYWPKVIGAILIIFLWVIIAIGVYRFIMYLFRRFKIIDLIDKLTINYSLEKENEESENKVSTKTKTTQKQVKVHSKLSQKIKIDRIVAKSSAYYIFLVFFRLAIVAIGINEVEIFLWDLLAYLPKLFLWIIIAFFGIRFANFIYDVVYNALDLTRHKTSKIIASWAKIIILFFTLMVALNYIDIVDQTIINTILIGFISMLTIAWWLAFWLWWKDIAHEILESFRK